MSFCSGCSGVIEDLIVGEKKWVGTSWDWCVKIGPNCSEGWKADNQPHGTPADNPPPITPSEWGNKACNGAWDGIEGGSCVEPGVCVVKSCGYYEWECP